MQRDQGLFLKPSRRMATDVVNCLAPVGGKMLSLRSIVPAVLLTKTKEHAAAETTQGAITLLIFTSIIIITTILLLLLIHTLAPS